MKIVRQIQKTQLLPGDVTENHIVVASVGIDKEPAIITRDKFDAGLYKLRTLKDCFTEGNSYSDTEADSLEHCVVKCFKKLKKVELEAFTDWRDALQWLLDNCKG